MAPHWTTTLRKEERRGQERRAAECSGLLTFNDCLWMIGTNKKQTNSHPAFVHSVCPASRLTKRKTSVSTEYR